MALAPPPARLQPRARLGDLLVRDGKITPEQLEQAMHERDAYGGRLGRTLIDLGFLDEPALQDTLSRQMQIPIVDLDSPGTIEAGCERYARADLAERWGFAPLQFSERRQLLVIAMSDPDPKHIRSIEEAIGRRVDVRIASSSSIERAHQRLYQTEANTATASLRGLQVQRSEQKRAPAPESPWAEPTPKPPTGWSTPSISPPVPVAAPVVKRPAVDPAKRYTASFEPDLEMPRESPLPRPASITPPPAPAPAALAQVAVDAALVGSLREQVKRLEEQLASQNRVLRALVEVLDEKGLVPRADLAKKHQGK